MPRRESPRTCSNCARRLGSSPRAFIQIAGSSAVYSAPIVATGDGPLDVEHHTNTGDRVLDVHIASPSPPGQFEISGTLLRTLARELGRDPDWRLR